jgi:hypothetical protein
VASHPGISEDVERCIWHLSDESLQVVEALIRNTSRKPTAWCLRIDVPEFALPTKQTGDRRFANPEPSSKLDVRAFSAFIRRNDPSPQVQ